MKSKISFKKLINIDKADLKTNSALFLVAFVVLLADQASKIAVLHFLPVYSSIPIWKNVFHFTHMRNSGAAFSLFSEHTFLLTIISIVAALIISLYGLFEKEKLPLSALLGLGFLLGGTLGNLIDRVLWGSVTDFLDFQIISFPVFNLADVFIDLGMVFLIYYTFFGARVEKVNEQANHNRC